MKDRPVDIDFANPPSFLREEILELLFNNFDGTFLLVNKSLLVVAANELTRNSIYEYFGVRIVDGITSVLEMVPAERRSDLKKIYTEIFEGAERFTETEVATKNGVLYFENHFKPARNEKGEITAAIITSRNITDKKKAEKRLKEIEERWRFALEGAKQGVWDWNLQTGDVFYSAAYKRMYGFEEHELKGRIEEWETMIHPEDRANMDQALSNHFGSSDPFYESTYRIRNKQGEYKWILARGMLSKDHDGKPVRMIGTHTDITEKVNIQEELRRSNERFSLASRATSDAIYDWNIATDELYWGEGMQTLFGFHPREVLMPMWENLIHPDDREKVSNGLYRLLQFSTKSNWKEEYRFCRSDGSFSYVLDRGFIMRDAQGKAFRMIGSMQDITDIKYNEQILSLERSILELSSNPNVPLNYIVETLLKGVEELHDDAYTAIYLLKEDESMEPFVMPRIPEAFVNEVKGLRPGPEDGSCGAAIARKEPVFVSDIDSDPLWRKYKNLCDKFRFRACWSMPIINSSGKIMATFAVYYKQVKLPSPSELMILERIKNILRILMEHSWSLNEIKIANERFDIMMKATHDLVWDWNLENNTIYRDENGLQKVYGVRSNKSINTAEKWLARIHPEDLEKAQNLISEIIQAKDEDTFEMEYRFQRDDGDYTYVYDRGKIIRNAEGRPIRMIGAAQDITERKQLEQELLRNELEKQKAINQATVDSQEQERTEIGKELHDNVNQVLTTTKLYLDLALSNTEQKNELIAKSNQNIQTVINEIRQLSRSLMDPTIGDLGLIDSLNDLVENINFTRKLSVSMKAERRLEFFLDKNHKLTIFRIVQETLNNAIKYANATNVFISCKMKGEHAEVIIEDNGVGFDPALVKKGAGLKNIQNRVYLINGTYQINSAPDQGCTIIVNFPLFK